LKALVNSRSPKDLARYVVCVLAIGGAVGAPSGSLAQDLEAERERKQAELQQAERRGEVLSTEITAYSSQIERLSQRVAELRGREAAVAQELEATQRRLTIERTELEALRDRLQRSLRILSSRLVEIYKSDQPDPVTVIMQSDGFDDLVNRYDYLTRIQEQDASIAARVRALRDSTEKTVVRVRLARDKIERRQAALAQARSALERETAQLDAVRADKEAALNQVRLSAKRLEGDISDLSAEIEKELSAVASTTASDPLPAGPALDTGGEMIWPVDGPLTSPFGPRWGRLHAGIDIAAPSGTPIRAAKAGRVTMAEFYGGYGNYTCIDHGGGLSTCYAHQVRLGTTAGASVDQGEVMGYVGNTGASFGDHLHFEVRVNGAPVDPMGYLR
jgi:murein DD-endopeptidase MepM/ murein hydrolase activator NlpD